MIDSNGDGKGGILDFENGQIQFSPDIWDKGVLGAYYDGGRIVVVLLEKLRGRLLQWKAEREEASGHTDPLEQQEISLRRIGDPQTPIPRRSS